MPAFSEYLGKNLRIINANNREINDVLENALSDQTGYVEISNFKNYDLESGFMSDDLELKPENIEKLVKYDIRLKVKNIGNSGSSYIKIGKDFSGNECAVHIANWNGKVERIN